MEQQDYTILGSWGKSGSALTYNYLVIHSSGTGPRKHIKNVIIKYIKKSKSKVMKSNAYGPLQVSVPQPISSSHTIWYFQLLTFPTALFLSRNIHSMQSPYFLVISILQT